MEEEPTITGAMREKIREALENGVRRMNLNQAARDIHHDLGTVEEGGEEDAEDLGKDNREKSSFQGTLLFD